jgi:hypothetical protein
MLDALVELWQNRDFYNVRIRTPDDTVAEQALADVKFMAGQGRPFFLTGMEKMAESGAPVEQQAAAFFGFMPASRQATMSAAEQASADLMQAQMPQGARTREAADHAALVGQVVRDLRRGTINSKGELETRLVAAGDHRRAQETDVLKRAMWSPMQYQVSRLPLADALRVWKLATPAEQEKLAEIMLAKADAAYKAGNLSPAEVRYYGELLGPALARARGRAAGERKGLRSAMLRE